MKKNILPILCGISLVALGIQSQSTFAESVAVVNNSVFIVDNSVAGAQILVKNFTDGTPNSCLANAGLNVLGLEQGTIATDILVNNGTAVVTTFNNQISATDVKFVDVSSCLKDQILNVGQCIATFENGVLSVPCVEYQNEIYSAVLEQRGNSMNWELKSSPFLNDRAKGLKHED
ncbi:MULTISPECIES: hypothetical protein [Nitrosomonas]|uniref:Uncharacterized protein n=1 Tax=Nitrosomonas communis TaxID=44574 RepID=A0A0F7KFV3_9PROT|nr:MULTISPECIES: hypothetical protein [Nitrosomonas]AKH37727.1 hypothetical protein AAW31_07805 [Nitrosomonas communis]TYP73699.1 hypothetical protein BCL69_10922 [Nitrosomonas communis]UVS63052.1 hypothetical protein NX761_08160 [Nitrosomonas sp. PLL12]